MAHWPDQIHLPGSLMLPAAEEEPQEVHFDIRLNVVAALRVVNTTQLAWQLRSFPTIFLVQRL